jgi:hypothetical protein
VNSTQVVHEESNVFQAGVAVARPTIRLSDFDSSRDADLTNMFGTWKETDHCDKDIRK